MVNNLQEEARKARERANSAQERVNKVPKSDRYKIEAESFEKVALRAENAFKRACGIR